MYSWENVAQRTEKVYLGILDVRPPPLLEKLRRFYGCGIWAGKLFCFLVAMNHLFYILLEWLYPRADIDICPDFDLAKYHQVCKNQQDEDVHH